MASNHHFTSLQFSSLFSTPFILSVRRTFIQFTLGALLHPSFWSFMVSVDRISMVTVNRQSFNFRCSQPTNFSYSWNLCNVQQHNPLLPSVFVPFTSTYHSVLIHVLIPVLGIVSFHTSILCSLFIIFFFLPLPWILDIPSPPAPTPFHDSYNHNLKVEVFQGSHQRFTV